MRAVSDGRQPGGQFGVRHNSSVALRDATRGARGARRTCAACACRRGGDGAPSRLCAVCAPTSLFASLLCTQHTFMHINIRARVRRAHPRGARARGPFASCPSAEKGHVKTAAKESLKGKKKDTSGNRRLRFFQTCVLEREGAAGIARGRQEAARLGARAWCSARPRSARL